MRTDHYEKTIQKLVATKAPLDGLRFQAHYQVFKNLTKVQGATRAPGTRGADGSYALRGFYDKVVVTHGGNKKGRSLTG